MKMTPVRAIRRKCLDCSCFQPSEVRNCVISECSLFPYRMGRRPRDMHCIRQQGLEEKAASRLGAFQVAGHIKGILGESI